LINRSLLALLLLSLLLVILEGRDLQDVPVTFEVVNVLVLYSNKAPLSPTEALY
jgi:hypothetical protein